MQPDQPDLAAALAKHMCELDACSDPAPCFDHLTVAGVALKFLGGITGRAVDAAYQRGLAEGLTEGRAQGRHLAITAVRSQAQLPDLMHFDRPSDFRKGVLSCLAALEALEGKPDA